MNIQSYTVQNNFRLMCTQLCHQRPKQMLLQVKNDVQKIKVNVTEPDFNPTENLCELKTEVYARKPPSPDSC